MISVGDLISIFSIRKKIMKFIKRLYKCDYVLHLGAVEDYSDNKHKMKGYFDKKDQSSAFVEINSIISQLKNEQIERESKFKILDKSDNILLKTSAKKLFFNINSTNNITLNKLSFFYGNLIVKKIKREDKQVYYRAFFNNSFNEKGDKNKFNNCEKMSPSFLFNLGKVDLPNYLNIKEYLENDDNYTNNKLEIKTIILGKVIYNEEKQSLNIQIPMPYGETYRLFWMFLDKNEADSIEKVINSYHK
ncbi:hypothetical protein IBE48_00020 [Francisella philomiragia]|uniref:Uncharacterized protein n=1 Tax=Francisella philomiragia TaxID=28110 RepID=A0AAW3D947_9GAMM|nr:hypothetical protein [Francisella philomiragia]KFJ42379.1 hypothetical protein DR78_4 [Francisella philomiragia]MBK2254326.1 hypothetical protein [Francisella philomiragia]MBK2268391.1 hypothetical protein [Francisella philomiragia]MBK2272639.1 hypothetical protein [Francisella philomiragia]MBK2276480.1 hypothetical protein [Francisella philomiragia]